MLSKVESEISNSRINEQDELLVKYRDNPTVMNRNDVVNKYINLAEIISKKFYNRGIDYEDIYQVACIALIKSVERFDLDKGLSLSALLHLLL